MQNTSALNSLISSNNEVAAAAQKAENSKLNIANHRRNMSDVQPYTHESHLSAQDAEQQLEKRSSHRLLDEISSKKNSSSQMHQK